MEGNYIICTFDIEHFQLDILKKFKKLAFRKETEFNFMPSVLKIYEPFETTLCKYYVNETGQVVTFYKIIDNLTEDEIHTYYKNYDGIEDKNKTHQKIIKDILNTFGAKIEPDSISILSIDKFTEEKIKWDHYRIFSKNFQVFLECQFIYQLTKSFDKNLNNYERNRNTYYNNKIMWNLSPSLFSIVNPRSLIINDEQYKNYLIYYDKWEITETCKNLSNKFNLVMLNVNHKNELEKNNNQNILNFFLLSLTFISTINLLPTIDDIFKDTIDVKFFAQIIVMIALIIFLILFFYPIRKSIRSIYYYFKNLRTISKMRKSEI